MTNDPTILDKPLRIGTRRSKLALWQANHIRDCLRARWGDRLDVQEQDGEGHQRPRHENGDAGRPEALADPAERGR